MKSVSLQNAVEHYLKRLHAGDDENVFFGLLDLGHAALPLLTAEAIKPENRPVLPRLVEVIWQCRAPEAIGFLGRTLSDPDPRVWKQALDGLVAIAGSDAVYWIRETRDRVESGYVRNGLSVE